MSFSLVDPPLLSRAAIGRDDQLRADTSALAEGWRTAKVLQVVKYGQFPARSNALVFRPALEIADEPPSEAAVFLGASGDRHVWAVHADELDTAGQGGELLDLRMAGHRLSPEEASLVSTAVAMLSWQKRSKFAPWSGEPMTLAKGGWVRVAPDGREDFPRTDPAVICLVHDGADQVLLARQPIWPQRWFSVLAGFCEPGESLEQCVEREILEEVGVHVTGVGYLGSQPWPFPRSLMLGFQATADPTRPVAPADGEIEEARWFHRDEVAEALEHRRDWGRGDVSQSPTGGDLSQSPTGLAEAPLLLPGSISIARQMIESWVFSRAKR